MANPIFRLVVKIVGVDMLRVGLMTLAVVLTTPIPGMAEELTPLLQGDAPLDMLVLLDRSGSMADSGKWSATVAELTDFFDGPIPAGTSAGLNFFPKEGIPDQCAPAEFDPIAIPLGELPGHATSLAIGMDSQTPTGAATPTYPALFGTLNFGATVSTTYPGHVAVVVLVTDGPPNECETATAEFTSLALHYFNCCFVRTYAVGLPGSSTTFLTSIAGAGGTGEAYILDDPLLLSDVMGQIRMDALGLEAIFSDGFESSDTTAWSSALP